MSQIRYIFLFGPNNSGTTVSCQYLAAQTGGYLPPYGHNEGQMAPAVRAMMRHQPWRKDTQFDWHWIRGEWDGLCRDAGKGLFIEGSPPNLMRVNHIRQVFDGSASYVFFLSNPWMQIASEMYNYATAERRSVESFMQQWLFKAAQIRQAMQSNPDIPLVTYEAFCAQPSVLNQALALPERAITPLAGKRAGDAAEIRDMSARNIAFLRAEEIDRINESLSSDPEILRAFGYEIFPSCDLLQRMSQQVVLFADGLKRRREWDRRLARR
jgi:hypothetical protein